MTVIRYFFPTWITLVPMQAFTGMLIVFMFWKQRSQRMHHPQLFSSSPLIYWMPKASAYVMSYSLIIHE